MVALSVSLTIFSSVARIRTTTTGLEQRPSTRALVKAGMFGIVWGLKETLSGSSSGSWSKTMSARESNISSSTRAGLPANWLPIASAPEFIGTQAIGTRLRPRPPPAAAAAAEEDEAAPPPMKKAKKATVYHMNINNAVDKEYEYCSLAEIASAPTSALQGISNKGCGVLKKFGVKSVKDLGRWKFYRMAKGIAGLGAVEVEGGRHEVSELNINKAMDKKHEGKALQDITKLPPSALQGLAGWADAELAHFGVKTIGALGEWKFAKWAEWITDLAEFETDDFTS
mmetsp:Transcript_58076/g.164734  ORF Transcript_58076/g.164734 Transcript_58076/m.164734 type:complete len:284 (-) Transcript_58076:130-981(-)